MTKLIVIIIIAAAGVACDRTEKGHLAASRETAVPSAITPRADARLPREGQMAGNDTDEALAQRVVTVLQQEPAFAPLVPLLTVEVDNGQVTLAGWVHSAQQRLDVAAKVQQVDGVSRVVNTLTVMKAAG